MKILPIIFLNQVYWSKGKQYHEIYQNYSKPITDNCNQFLLHGMWSQLKWCQGNRGKICQFPSWSSRSVKWRSPHREKFYSNRQWGENLFLWLHFQSQETGWKLELMDNAVPDCIGQTRRFVGVTSIKNRFWLFTFSHTGRLWFFRGGLFSCLDSFTFSESLPPDSGSHDSYDPPGGVLDLIVRMEI